MPQANITYDVPYNKKLTSILDEMDEKHWQKAYPAYHPNPMGYRLGAFHGEMVGGGSSPMKYTPSGNSPAYPPHNLSSGLAVHSGGSYYAGIDGAVGMGHPANRRGGDWIDDLGKVVDIGTKVAPLFLGLGRKRKGKKGGDLKQSAARILSDAGRAISGAVNTAAPYAKQAAIHTGTALLPVVTDLAKKYAEKKGKEALGLGRKKKGGKSMPLGEMVEAAVPVGGTGVSGGKRTNKRAAIVKKVMKEKGMKLIEASKYVKAHGLY